MPEAPCSCVHNIHTLYVHIYMYVYICIHVCVCICIYICVYMRLLLEMRGCILRVSRQSDPYHLGSLLGPPDFGNPHMYIYIYIRTHIYVYLYVSFQKNRGPFQSP